MLPVPTCAVPFTVHRVKGARTLWINDEAMPADEGWSDARFADEFGFAVADTPCFADVEFDRTVSKTLLAERYGGFGTGNHGGGARAGGWERFQLKGIGRNMLAAGGDGTINGAFHSFGGFPLVDALCELVNSEVLSRVLPVGVVRCLGLVLTGERTAFYPQRADTAPSFGVILVREQCLRPAHFIRNGGFEVGADLLLTSGSDLTRLRTLCRGFQEALGGEKAFVAHLGKFLANSANQLALARLFRISHGSLSPSNLATDGRWLDMMGSSLLPPGCDYAPAPWVARFSGEPDLLKSVMVEWASTQAKFCGTDIATAPLLGYFDRQFGAYTKLHLPAFFGLPSRAIAACLDTPDGRALADAAGASVTDGLVLTDRLPLAYRHDRDPCLRLVRDLFLGEEGGGPAPPPIPAPVRRGFEALLGEAGAAAAGGRDPGRFRDEAMVAAMRRLHFSSFFYRGRLIGEASDVALSGDLRRVEPLIRGRLAAADWVFAPPEEEEDGRTIVDFGGVRIRLLADGSLLRDVRGDVGVLDGPGRFDAALRVIDAEGPALVAPALFGFPPVPPYDFGTGAREIIRALARAASLR